ncbi:MAG: LysM peptidoglycan-binding domain-containing protein [Aggregatilineales bacterium]
MRRVLMFAALIGIIALMGLGPISSVNAQQSGTTTYVVQPGDTLFRIALRYNVTVAQIAALNGIANPNLIFAGQTLQIPTGGPVVTATPPPPGVTVTPPPGGGGTTTYVVQSGDTLFRIASRFGVTVAAIVQANGIVNPNLIFVGQVLTIPGGNGGPVVTPPPSGTVIPPPPSAGGFSTGGQASNFGSGTTQNAMRSAHMTWVKNQLQYSDNSYGGQISQAHGAGFKILLSIVGDKNAVLNAGYFDQFAAYVAQVAGQGADAIEVWNEENLDRQWPTNHISAASYTQLLAKAYGAIKGANPNTIVISGAPSPTGAQGAFPGAVVNDDVYYAGMAAAGAANYADCIGVHYNEGIVSPTQTSGDPRDNYPTRYYSTMLNRALASFPGKQACFTELGYLSPQGYGPLPANFGWAGNTTVAQQALWLGQAESMARASGRVRLFVVFNVDLTYYGPDDPQAGYAIIRPGGSCPGCATLGSS